MSDESTNGNGLKISTVFSKLMETIEKGQATQDALATALQKLTQAVDTASGKRETWMVRLIYFLVGALATLAGVNVLDLIPKG